MKENDNRINAYMKASGLLKTTKESSKQNFTDSQPTINLPSNVYLKAKKNSDNNEKDSIYRRVAKFLLLIGIDEAAKIIPHLSPEQTEKIIPEIASIRNSQVMIGRYRTLDDYFAESVTNVGLKGEQAEINLLSQNTVMSDLRTLRDSISGVNIDEELANIIKFQHGYNASARFITVIDELLDTVINRLGV